MSNKYNKPGYPPNSPWDSRLTHQDICRKLQPVSQLHENSWFQVFNRGGYYTIEPTQSHCVVLPVINNSSILMVRVYRPVIDDVTLELPAGAFDPKNERPEEGAAREFLEETGIGISDTERFKPLVPISVSPNRNPYLAHTFQVHLSDEEYNNRKSHDHEIESVEKVSLSAAAQYIIDGTIYVSVPIALIGRYLLSIR